MELLADYTQLEDEILVQIFKENVANLPLHIFTEILEYIEMYRDVDDVFVYEMKNNRVDVKRKITNKKSYLKNKPEVMEKDIEYLKTERDQLAHEWEIYKYEIQWYRWQIGILNRDLFQNNELFSPKSYRGLVNTNDTTYSTNINVSFATENEYNQHTQYQNIFLNHDRDNVEYLIRSFDCLGLDTH